MTIIHNGILIDRKNEKLVGTERESIKKIISSFITCRKVSKYSERYLLFFRRMNFKVTLTITQSDHQEKKHEVLLIHLR
jgi:hypothetical protein